MATEIDSRDFSTSESSRLGESADNGRPEVIIRPPSKLPLVLFLLFVSLCFAAVLVWAATQVLGDQEPDAKGVLTHTVEPTDMLITVADDGNVESASNVDIKCQVAGGGTILWIVEDGKQVQGGLESSTTIPFDADADAVKTAMISGMPSITDDNVIVTGEGTTDSPFVIELVGNLGESNVEQLSVDASSLTGDGIVTVSTLQPGVTVEDGPGTNEKQSFDITPTPSGGTYKINWNATGELLVQLDTSALEEQLQQQRIVFEQALAMKIQSEEDFGAAEIAVREFDEGTYLQQLQVADAEIQIATEALRSSENVLEFTESMVRKGFATPLQLAADRASLQQAQFNLNAAETTRRVLTDFTHEKTMKQLIAVREASGARSRSDQASLQLESTKLARLEEQITNSEIFAPQSGMAVYANDMSRRRSSSEPMIEEGAQVREGQTILKLPDLSNMQVRMTVHESKVDQIEPGMPARITILEQSLSGHVISIGNQPEPGSWGSSNIKEYATTVAIDGQTTGLRPGMTASVVVLINECRDALTVPVSAVVEKRGSFFCYMRGSNGVPVEFEVLLGLSNVSYIQVIEGVEEGDVVIRNPRVVVEDAFDDTPLEERSTDRSDFGERVTIETTAQAQAGGRGQGGGLMQFDADGDGKISRDEAPDWASSFFASADTDGDGLLDSSELSALRQQRGGGGSPGGGGGRSGGAGGDRQ